MIKKLKTSIAFTKNLFVVGAITETSRNTEIEICRYIPKEENKIIVEFGMGHGNITREILNNISSTSKLYAFEVNKDFCKQVESEISDSRLIIINDGAENIKKHINENIDSVIGSIPFSFFSKEKGMGIIQDSYDKLVDNGYFSQVLYTKFNFKKFEQIFDKCSIKSIKNTPTEYIYHCKKECN
jgi:phospholipid N-methyltransferase